MVRQVLLSDHFNTEVQKQLIECFDKDGKGKLLLSALYLFFPLSPFMRSLTCQKDDSIPYLTEVLELATVCRIKKMFILSIESFRVECNWVLAVSFNVKKGKTT